MSAAPILPPYTAPTMNLLWNKKVLKTFCGMPIRHTATTFTTTTGSRWTKHGYREDRRLYPLNSFIEKSVRLVVRQGNPSKMDHCPGKALVRPYYRHSRETAAAKRISWLRGLRFVGARNASA